MRLEEYKDYKIVKHCIKEIKKTNEFKIEMEKFKTNKVLNFENFSFIHLDNIRLKNSFQELNNLIYQQNFEKAIKLAEEVGAQFTNRNTIEYGIYLKNLAKIEYENGIINKAIQNSAKSVELLQIHLSEFHPIMIETRLDYYIYKTYFSNNFQKMKNNILKCLVNSIIVNDYKSIVLSYMCLGHSYKVYGQIMMNVFYNHKGLKLFRKYKIKDISLERDVYNNMFYSLPLNKTFSNIFIKKHIKKVEKFFNEIKDNRSLGKIHYYIAANNLMFTEYNKVIAHIDKAETFLKMEDGVNRMLIKCNIKRWEALSRMGRVGYADKFLNNGVVLMQNLFGKTNFNLIELYQEIALNYIFIEDSHTCLKYLKIISEIINEYYSNPSPLKLYNLFLYSNAYINLDISDEDLKAHLHDFSKNHRLMIGDESELKLTLIVIFTAYGKINKLKLFDDEETIN